MNMNYTEKKLMQKATLTQASFQSVSLIGFWIFKGDAL